MIGIADANIELLRQIGLIQLRPGRMTRQAEATRIVQEALRPLDTVFVHSENRMSGHLIPGQFTHGAVYIGTEAQLRAAGLWHLPALAPYRDQIRAGAVFLEAVDGGVRLIDPATVLNTDAVVILRPETGNRAAILRRGISHMGVPFDMRFDAADPSHLFCAELISLMYPAADLPRLTAYGRETILIDAIVAGALTGDLPFAVVGYVETNARGGARALSTRDLAWRIRQAWDDAGPREGN
ncbi:hypothetical protein roselon_03075 [Roseibacterium elongatum DSM 19469]|uniref:Uncharacterized protein n=2 Tax=Roseicyclus elongatus TaxID=159346 RepID=W8RVN4_9RHOB|nr:hypothetical protein roselon_03075 [Roseibacterium elongatum DSM 19469]